MATFLNEIKEGASWPETFAEGLLLSSDAGRDTDPLGYRALLMLPTMYRLGKDAHVSLSTMCGNMGSGRDVRRDWGPGGGPKAPLTPKLS